LISIKINDSYLGRPQADGIIRELCAAAGIPVSDNDAHIELVYGEKPEPSPELGASILVPACRELALLDVEYAEVEGRTVPILYSLRADPGDSVDLLITEGNAVKLNFDLPLAAYRLLAGLDEDTAIKRDKHGRVRRQDMTGWYYQASRLPVVTSYVEILIKAYEAACATADIPPVRAARWPGAAPYAVVISHDVDQLTNYNRRERFRSVIGSLARFNKPPTFDFMSAERAYGTFPAIMEIEEEYGAVSTFFVGSVKRGALDYNYTLEKVRPLLKDIEAFGAEIALHSSYYCNGPYQLTEEFSALSDAVGFEVKGVRGHYLRVAPARLWRWADEVGFEYDASLGYFDDIGFRRMHCLPFATLYGDGTTAGVYEIPLSLMDGTLFQYLALGIDEAIKTAGRFLGKVKAAGGLFSVLWHYRAFSGGQYPEWAEVFETILSRASGDGACFLTHAQAVEQRKSWALFGAALTKHAKTTDVVLSGAPGTNILVPEGWSAGDKDDRVLTIPFLEELEVTFKPKETSRPDSYGG
jgi:peptidoglycan/xylan/chitin deacetylase (PgdA/CDA1 family)